MITIKRRRISSSGLKIRLRIPSGFKFGRDSQTPASPGAPPRACGTTSCKRTVEANSRWKLCKVCRSKYRKYQRKRIGVMNPRPDLEDEVEEPEPVIAHTQDAQINTAEAAAHVRRITVCSASLADPRTGSSFERELSQMQQPMVHSSHTVRERV